MRNRLLSLYILFIIFIFAIKNSEAQKNADFKKAIPQAAVDTIYKYVLTYPNETQFSVAIIRNNAVSFIGVQKKNDLITSINNKDSVFEIGSITKIFTSNILVNLILDGKIDPDEPVSKSLPFKLYESEKSGIEITYKMLSNHTSGIPPAPDNINDFIKRNPENPWVDFGKKQFEQYLSTRMILDFTPGTQYEYSNLGVALLGKLIELKTGKSYESLLQSMVFKKYKMNSTTTVRNKIDNRLVHGHNEIGKPVLNWDFNAIAEAGACFSSANDLSRFVLVNFSDDPVLMYQRQRTFVVPNNAIDLAYGWLVFRSKGLVWYFHSGGTGGYHSNISMDIEQKCAVIILTNCSFDPTERYLEKISWKILMTLIKPST
jgi:CubicO group peptidase (beta-lactamase class C family)